jgi:hypothetical protein
MRYFADLKGDLVWGDCSGSGGRRVEICHSPVAELRETTPTYWLPSFSSSSTLIACCSKVSSFFSRVEH